MSLDFPAQDKQIKTPPAKKVFVFPGDGIFHPERIEAETREAAEALYHKVKRLISGPAAGAAPTPAAPASAPEQSTPPSESEASTAQ